MKIRKSFVSNSSSTCFILDKRNEDVQKLLKHVHANRPSGYERSTAMAIGRDAVDYARKYDEEDDYSGLRRIVLEYAEKLGKENVVFIRESDEGAGGELFGQYDYDDERRILLEQKLKDLALIEFEYH